MKHEKSEKLLVKYGALLLFLGLLTGIYSAAAMTGKIAADPHTALAAHIVALMGTFMIFGAAYSMQFLNFTDSVKMKLSWVFIVSSFANWIITSVKALFKVSGIDFNGEPANDTVFVILNLFVVLPLLAGSGFWVYGLWKKEL